jgi:hypothetical protein
VTVYSQTTISIVDIIEINSNKISLHAGFVLLAKNSLKIAQRDKTIAHSH